MNTRLNVCVGLVLLGFLTKPMLGQVDSLPADSTVASKTEFRVSGNVHVSGVTMQGLPGHVRTDASGRYVATVPLNWIGTITPQKEGVQFFPTGTRLTRVTGDMDNVDFNVMRPSLGIGSSNQEVLVVPTTEVMPNQFAAIQQDMRVMLHILKKAVQDEKNPLVGGVFSQYGNLLGRNESSLQSLYIQGYGALFFVQANIPLEWSAEPVLAVGPEGQDGESADPVWQQARNQVFNPASQANQPRSSRRDTEALMRKLIDGLKHATNIRYLGPEERVVVTVLSGSDIPGMFGMAAGGGGGGRPGGYYRASSGRGGGGSRGGGTYGGGGGYGDDMMMGGGGEPYGRSGTSGEPGMGRSSGFAVSPGQSMPQAGPKSTLTLQATKAQIDAFAQGKMMLDEFLKYVQVIRY
ncbi:MAG: hypothetical protein GY809_16565 [Planctomycetes bacterium]|nr:hypothetical protein [Planctomycetota bacterium]